MPETVGIGIDFGTSNSSAALFDGEQVTCMHVEPVGDDPEVMPTALYLTRQRGSAIGCRAIESYVRENVGRQVELSREKVGEIEITVAATSDTHGADGSLTDTSSVYALTDQAMPGRLFRGVKRWLGSPGVERVRVFDTHFRLVALVTPVLEHLRKSTSAVTGATGAVHIGRPVHYEGPGAQSDEVALRRMREACGHAGFGSFTLYPEPVAAALSFLHKRGGGKETVLTFDFGGGTLDLSLMRAAKQEFELLATHGTGMGGDEINRLLYRRRVFPELGEGIRYSRLVDDHLSTVRFPFRDFAGRLLNWTLAYELNRSDLCELMGQAMRTSEDARCKIGRLFELVTQNRAHQVFQSIERAKVELSARDSSSIDVPELDLSVPVSRADFDEMLTPVLSLIRTCVEDTVSMAGLRPGDVDVVVRTGGSSQIPAVLLLLEEIFPGRIVEHDPFTSIAAGLAIASYHGYS